MQYAAHNRETAIDWQSLAMHLYLFIQKQKHINLFWQIAGRSLHESCALLEETTSEVRRSSDGARRGTNLAVSIHECSSRNETLAKIDDVVGDDNVGRRVDAEAASGDFDAFARLQHKLFRQLDDDFWAAAAQRSAHGPLAQLFVFS